MKRIAILIVAAVPLLLLGLAPAQEKGTREPDVIYVPTPYEVVDKMFELADIRPGEIVYDLGCGDARIPVMAAKKFGVKAWGFDINPVRVKESLENVKKNQRREPRHHQAARHLRARPLARPTSSRSICCRGST